MNNRLVIDIATVVEAPQAADLIRRSFRDVAHSRQKKKKASLDAARYVFFPGPGGWAPGSAQAGFNVLSLAGEIQGGQAVENEGKTIDPAGLCKTGRVG